MEPVIKFLTDYQGGLTDFAHFDKEGSIVDRYSLSTCSLLVEAGVAEWVTPEPTEDAPTVKRGRKPKAAAE